MAAEYTLVSDRFPDGTTVYANVVGPLRSQAVAAVVSGNTAVFEGLRELETYVAHATVGGRYVEERFQTGGGGVSGGTGLSFVPTDADLPATGTLGDVLLVLEDFTNVDENDLPLATLRYWDGSVWKPIGISAGGPVGGGSGDFIVLDVNLAGRHNGDTLLFDDDTDLYISGGLS